MTVSINLSGMTGGRTVKYRLQDLIDIEQLQALQDRLYEVYSFPSAIIDTDGNILTATAWQDVCTKFHRRHKECERECVKSNQHVIDGAVAGESTVSYRCSHGLFDTATPINVNGTHLGNFFTGQFFLEGPDLEFFRARARIYGFDEDLYLEAVKKVPVRTQGQLDGYLCFVRSLIEVISGNGLKSLRVLEARQESEESDRQFKAMFEMASVGMAQADPHTGRLLRVNQKMCDITGYTARELLALRVPEVTHPEDRERDWDAFQRVIRGEAPHYRMEKRYLRKDGTTIWVNVNMTVIREASGQAVRTMATIEDITERKQTEEALRESEQNFRTLADSGQALIWTSGTDKLCNYFNRVWLAFTGRSLEQEMGNGWAEGVHPDDFQRCLDTYVGAFERREEFCMEYRLRRHDGEYRWLLDEGAPRCNSKGEFIGYIGHCLDITDRKQAEEALRESEAELELALRSAHMGAWYWDIPADRRSFDDQVCHLLGLNPETFGGTAAEFFAAVHPEDHEKLAAALSRTIAQHVPYAPEYRAVWPDGTIHHISARGRLVRDEGGQPQRISGIIWDITETKRAEEEKAKLENQLQQAQKMESVGRLAGGVAHDFNNMLAAILGYAEIALGQVDPAQPLHEDLVEIRRAAERSAELTRQLLTFARKQTVAPRVLDLNDTVSGMLKMLQRLIGEDIHLEWHPAANLWAVKVDPSQIDQILANLCVNARDAIADVGKITIESRNKIFDEEYCIDHGGFAVGEYVMLAVSDDGRGMDKATRAHIFEPFFTTKGVGEGTGLGLATVYGAVRQNNGFINVYSEPGAGTTFAVYLPRHADEVEPARPQSAAGPALRGQETILLAEDEPAVLKLTTKLLEAQGYTVLVAHGPVEAMRIARQYSGEIRLLMTDVVMPEMNGRDLANNISALHPHLKRLFMSGYTANVIVHHGVLDVGVQFIQKPFSARDLAAKVREVLDSE